MLASAMAARTVRRTTPQLTLRTRSHATMIALAQPLDYARESTPTPVTTRSHGIVTGIAGEHDSLSEPDGHESSRGHFPAC